MELLTDHSLSGILSKGDKIVAIRLKDEVFELKTVDIKVYDIAKVFFG